MACGEKGDNPRMRREIPRGVGHARDYAELAKLVKADLRMAAGTHTRALGTPPAQIRTYEEVSNDSPS